MSFTTGIFPDSLKIAKVIGMLKIVKEQIAEHLCKESFLISPCTKNEILEIISSLDYHKAMGINSIPIKILKIVKEQIAEHI